MPFLHSIRKLPKLSGDAWRYYYDFFAGDYGKIFWTTFAAAGQILIIIPSLLLVRYAFDEVIPDHNIPLLVWIGVAIFVLRLLNSWISVVLRNIHIRVINRAIVKLRENLLGKLYEFTHLFFVNSDLRTLHTRIVQDTERLTNMSTALISRLLPSIIISLGLLVVCFILNWYLLLIIVSLFPFLVLANRIMGRKIRSRVFIFQRAFEEFSKGIYFVLKYMPLTTVQSAQKEETERQKAILTDLQHKTGRMAEIFSLNLQLQDVLSGLTAIVIIIIGGVSVALKNMTLGEFLSFYLAAMYLNKYVNYVTSSIPDIIAGYVSLNTLHALAVNEEVNRNQGAEVIGFDGEIELRSVTFSYGPHQVLQQVNLHIPPGERIAIIGANGSGKTTILNLITGLLVPDKGSILASGRDYTDLDIIALRKSIGIVAQHPPLFPGSIAENISYGAEGMNGEQLARVAALAQADQFIAKLPDGFDTQIGDEGVLLSGGEGQRIAIARALYRNPSLLILDEPTNHLDHETVGSIMANLQRLPSMPAILIISHDEGVVSFADRIYQLENGMLTPLVKT